MSYSAHYRSFRRRFYGSYDPTNSVVALKDDGWSTRSRANPTRLSSLKGKEKDVTKNAMYITPRRWKKIQRRSDDRELNQARSKPNIVDRPIRTACTFVGHYNRTTQYCSTEIVFLIFLFLQTNTTSTGYLRFQMWPSGGKGDVMRGSMGPPISPSLKMVGFTIYYCIVTF